MTANSASVTSQNGEDSPCGPLVYRISLPVRIWHGINALCIFVLLMSGATIFNAHPRLYWGKAGANFDHAWLVAGRNGEAGFLRVGQIEFNTTGFLGHTPYSTKAIPPLLTIPNYYSLAEGRQWHFFFAWLLVVSITAFLIYSLCSKHLRNDLLPRWKEISPSRLWKEIVAHVRLRFASGHAAKGYNPLQKLAYLGVIFGLIPLAILTGITMSPNLNAAFPWLLDLFGGRQSARSIHFICSAALCLFIFIHLLMILAAGPLNEMRAIITGWFRLPQAQENRP